jgi:hypothetical protein
MNAIGVRKYFRLRVAKVCNWIKKPFGIRNLL